MIKSLLTIFTALSIGGAPVSASAEDNLLTRVKNYCVNLLKRPQKSLPAIVEKAPEQSIPEAIAVLNLYAQSHFEGKPMPTWAQLVRGYLDPFVKSSSKELTISVIGPANSGKSTFFNMIPALLTDTTKEVVELSDSRVSAGTTEHPTLLTNSDLGSRLSALEQRFGPLTLSSSAPANFEPGSHIVHVTPDIYENLIFVDSPSFDISGLRERSEDVLIRSDVIIYLFTEANYKNEWNLNYLQQKFKEIGNRPVILVYRASRRATQIEALNHVREVAQKLFPTGMKDTETMLPVQVLGAYLTVDSTITITESNVTKLTPIFFSPEFELLMRDLSERHQYFRRGALQNALAVALTGFSVDLNESRQVPEEVRITRSLLELILASSVKSSAKNIPYYHLADELENVWFGYSMGLRGMSRMVAQPGSYLKGGRRDLKLTGKGFTEIEQFLKGSVDHAIAQFLLAISRGNLKISTDVSMFNDVYQDLQKFRSTHNIPAGMPPNIQMVGPDSAVISLNLQRMHEKMHNLLNRNWDDLAERAKEDVGTDYRELTGVIQGEFQHLANEALKTRNPAKKAIGGLYPVLAFTPAAMSAYLAVSQNWSLFDIKTLSAGFVSWLMLKYFVKLDEKHLKREWIRVIDSWYERRQRPRVLNILKRHLMPLNLGDQQKSVTPEMSQYMAVEEAIESLTRQSVITMEQWDENSE